MIFGLAWRSTYNVIDTIFALSLEGFVYGGKDSLDWRFTYDNIYVRYNS